MYFVIHPVSCIGIYYNIIELPTRMSNTIDCKIVERRIVRTYIILFETFAYFVYVRARVQSTATA